ncbi:MAG: hypothetical protein J5U17_04245 [Candidatus Methanoperedens sp.]|nr:hypothetical protein [Candidatus Methanoperedens sp.]
MNIQDITSEELNKTSDSNKELNPAEKWLFDIQNGEVRLFTMMKMKNGQQSISELNELKEYASEADIKYGIDRTLNWTFLQGNLPLIARSENDKIVIKKTGEHTKAIVIFV